MLNKSLTNISREDRRTAIGSMATSLTNLLNIQRPQVNWNSNTPTITPIVASDFQELLMTSYVSTIEPIAFNAAGFDKQVTLDGEQLNKIFSKIKFLSYALDSNIGLHSGDIYFNDEEEKTEYIINVSAACDMRNKKAYFVFGEETSSPRTHDIVCTYTIKRILGKKGIEFHLNDAELLNIGENVNEINIQRKGKVKIYKRAGRLLNPYIIALQNKFSSYITRVGVFRES